VRHFAICSGVSETQDAAKGGPGGGSLPPWEAHMDVRGDGIAIKKNVSRKARFLISPQRGRARSAGGGLFDGITSAESEPPARPKTKKMKIKIFTFCFWVCFSITS